MKGKHTGTTTLRFRELPNDRKPSTLIIVDVDLRKVEAIEGVNDGNIITGTLFLALAGKKPQSVSKKPMARGDENDWRFGHITFDLNDYMPFLSTVKGIWKFHVEARRDGLGTEMSQLLPPPLKYEIGTDDVRRKELERYENEQYLTELINFAENPQPPTAEDMEVLETRSDSGN